MQVRITPPTADSNRHIRFRLSEKTSNCPSEAYRTDRSISPRTILAQGSKRVRNKSRNQQIRKSTNHKWESLSFRPSAKLKTHTFCLAPAFSHCQHLATIRYSPLAGFEGLPLEILYFSPTSMGLGPRLMTCRAFGIANHLQKTGLELSQLPRQHIIS